MSKKRHNHEASSLFDREFLPAVKALNIVLYDVSGAPLNHDFMDELISKAEEIAQREFSLALTIIKD